MEILHVITFLIHAIVGAMASMLGAVFTRLVPALVALAVVLALIFGVCTSCGLGGAALLRKRKRQDR